MVVQRLPTLRDPARPRAAVDGLVELGRPVRGFDRVVCLGSIGVAVGSFSLFREVPDAVEGQLSDLLSVPATRDESNVRLAALGFFRASLGPDHRGFDRKHRRQSCRCGRPASSFAEGRLFWACARPVSQARRREARGHFGAKPRRSTQHSQASGPRADSASARSHRAEGRTRDCFSAGALHEAGSGNGTRESRSTLKVSWGWGTRSTIRGFLPT